MKYFIDLDNTLCRTEGTDYANAQPIPERIQHVRRLKEKGHMITIWTGRGTVSGKNYDELTREQLQRWNVPYDGLLFGKPDYDIYIDDKSFQVNDVWRVPPATPTGITKKLDIKRVEKGWGHELIFVNLPEYCGKILHFEEGKKFSMHYHVKKKETWYVASGRFLMHWIDHSGGIVHTEYLNVGDTITNERGEPHQIEALEEGDIFEVSTQHFDEDSYRIWIGD
jgi:mannose-6-phosphate isomerase-like protein (cupin superfamily)/uncharacterized protein YheU (UPF0270 family)